ncbi:MAG TPA: imidazole glycerol phosphate synthase subunit HisF [Gammaproteobacteria bacterium]|nr:imidazole glycerol phosphate synthase subunit HisF [Gammaproteobacteria bacterium]
MLMPRIIPCLLVKDKGLIKTVQFKDPKYVGDPINAVKIFNEKEVDELIVLDVGATANNNEPDYKMIENLANECRMPLCYGGGITTADQAQKILSLGVEKVALSSSAVNDPGLIYEIAARTGSQSVVIVLDVKKKVFGGFDIYTHNGRNKVKIDLLEFVRNIQKMGAGEIVINSIDNDGRMRGYDFNLINKVKPVIEVPMTILGGAGSVDDIRQAVQNYGIIGCAAGSLFVFKGKYRAVLISYVSHTEKDDIFNSVKLPS